ncbi:unnamed protein product [Rotaria sp. Silwood2]|nr:unnamed protein product [Rotaria sp. Silwood2]
MIFDNFTIIFEQVETETPRTLTAKEDLELKHLALINNCHIVKIETKSKTKICSVPKAITITTISHQSKFITNQSILFSSSASVFYKVSISYASIEIHTMSNRFMDQKVDLTILSSTTDAIKEDIDINKDNSFVETQSGRKFVFVQWNLPSYNDDVQIKSKFKKKIKKFVSTSLQLITSNIKDEHLETIMFSTTEWEKCSNKKEFASEMINEIQHQLETRIGCRWRILFVFSKDEKQTELCQEFLSVMSTKQNEKDGFVAVSVPVTVTEITLSISRNNVWKKCQNALKDYIKQTICITKKLENQVDLKLWSQHMINAFYQYCITKYVILRMSLNNTEQIIELTGHTDTVDEAFDKYRLMTEILKQKVIEVAGSTMQSEPPNTSKTSSRKTTRNESTSSKEYYNIWLSYCKLDKKICSRLKERLIDEGYLVATNTSDDHTVTIKKCDLIILYLSEEYALSNASEMKEAKSSDKKILLIKPTKLACRGKNNWLHSMTTKQLSYELFNGNFTIELDTNNFDQEYDRLLIEILCHTKPGVVGQPYVKPRAVASEKSDNEDNFDQPYFTNDRQLTRISQLTTEQQEERKATYDKYLKILMKKNKIPADEMENLMKSCTSMIEGTSQEENEIVEDIDYEDSWYRNVRTKWLIKVKHRESQYRDEEKLLRQSYIDELLLCVKCWQRKRTNIIKQNVVPFTLTGDINDASFPMPISNKQPWCNFDETLVAENDNSNDKKQVDSHENYSWLIPKYNGSWFTLEESHYYYQEFIDKDTLRQLRRLEEQSTTPHDKQNEQQPSQIKKRENTQEKVALTAYTSNQDIYRKVEEHPDFVTKIKRGKVAWDITDDRLVKLSTQPYSKLDLEWFTPMKQRVQNTRTIILGSKKRFSICERSWNYYKKKQLETIEEINKSQGNNSDLIQQRRIGDELKKKEEMDKLLKLDDPNRIWRIPENFSQKFFEQKKKNIIEFKQLCVE